MGFEHVTSRFSMLHSEIGFKTDPGGVLRYISDEDVQMRRNC